MARRPRTHCKHGHRFTAHTTRYDKRGHRRCKPCFNAYHRDYQRRLVEARYPELARLPKPNRYHKWWLARYTLAEIHAMFRTLA